MNKYLLPAMLVFVCPLGACSSTGGSSASATVISSPLADAEFVSRVADETRETMLLVSLDDGTVVMQKIHSAADVCFKKNSDSATTCLRQGAPVIDPASNAIIGFEMIEDSIQLIAKAD